MFARRFLFSTLFTVLLVVLLAAGGYTIYRLGLSQGYAAGTIVAAKTGAPGQTNGVGTPWFPYGPYYGFPFFPPLFFGFGMVFLIWLFIFPLIMISRLVRFWTWRMAGGPESEAYLKGWRHFGRHMPPWGWYPPDQPEPKTQPDPASKTGDQTA